MKEIWSLKIMRVDNGYYLIGSGGERYVIEENPSDEMYHHDQLLRQVMDYFNFYGTKHDEKRIEIRIRGKDEEDLDLGELYTAKGVEL